MLLCFGFCVGLQFLGRLCRSMSWFPLCLVVKSPLVFVSFMFYFFPVLFDQSFVLCAFDHVCVHLSHWYSVQLSHFPQLCPLSLMCVFKPCFLGLILCFYCASINLKPISSLVSILSIFRSTDLYYWVQNLPAAQWIVTQRKKEEQECVFRGFLILTIKKKVHFLHQILHKIIHCHQIRGFTILKNSYLPHTVAQTHSLHPVGQQCLKKYSSYN